jgi:VWFA-related protein
MARPVARLLSTVLFFSIALIPLWAQAVNTDVTTDEKELPTFTSDSRLVLVPVLVKGKNGEHMSGLGRDVFHVEEHGKARTIATFEELKPVAPEAKGRTAPRLEGRSNFNFEEAPRGHMTIVVLDFLNTPYLYQGESKRRLIEVLTKALPDDEATAVFALGTHGLMQLYAPTTDTAGLLNSMRGVTGAPIVTGETIPSGIEVLSNAEFGSLATPIAQNSRLGVRLPGGDLLDSNWLTLTAMTQIAHAYSSVPGRKTLIWASGGMSYAPTVGASRSTILEKSEEAWRQLNTASVAVYSVDVSGLAPFNGSLTSYRNLGSRERSLRDFADATGGLWCAGATVDIDKCLTRAFQDSGTYYMLGYYLPSDDQKPGWRKLKVKVDAPEARVRAREGFYITAGADEKADDKLRELLDALRSPVELTGVRFNVREVAAGATKTAGGKTRRQFAIGVLGDSVTLNQKRGNALDVSVTAIAFGLDGHEHARVDYPMKANLPQELVAKFRRTGLSTQQEMDLAPGKYEIHFAVRDNLSGEIGTVTYPLVVK